MEKSTRFIQLVSPASSYNNIDVASCESETDLCISTVFKIAFVNWKGHLRGIVAKIYHKKKKRFVLSASPSVFLLSHSTALLLFSCLQAELQIVALHVSTVVT